MNQRSLLFLSCHLLAEELLHHVISSHEGDSIQPWTTCSLPPHPLHHLSNVAQAETHEHSGQNDEEHHMDNLLQTEMIMMMMVTFSPSAPVVGKLQETQEGFHQFTICITLNVFIYCSLSPPTGETPQCFIPVQKRLNDRLQRLLHFLKHWQL